MASLAQGITDLFQSIFKFIAGVFQTVFGSIQALVSAVVRLFMDLFNMAEGLVGFVVGNLFLLVIIGAVVVGYRAFAGKQTVVVKEKKRA